MITMVILLVLLILFVIIGVPLAFAIGASCVTYLVFTNPALLMMVPQKLWTGSFSDLMIAMPLFMLAGDIMSSGGLTKRIISFCKQILRPIHGGLGEVNIVDSMIFGGISGSSVADTSALGSIIIPAMEADGYPRKVAAGITVASSTMGMIIPPSTPMIVYSMISGASVGALFLAGAIPGILVGVCQLAFVVFMSVKNHWHPAREKFNAKEFWRDILGGVPAILMPLFIILVVSTGICTASESAGAAVFYALIVGFFIYKELTWKDVWEAVKNTFVSSASVMIIIGFTSIFTYILTMQGVPDQVGAFFANLDMPRWAIAIIFDIMILLIGCFIDVSPAILLLTSCYRTLHTSCRYVSQRM